MKALPGPFNMVSDMSDVTRGTGTLLPQKITFKCFGFRQLGTAPFEI